MENEFNPEDPICPVCGGGMFDNRLDKKNPKAPDFKCKQKACRYELDKKTGEWIVSEYTTAVWLPKGNTFRSAVAEVKKEQAQAKIAQIRSENKQRENDKEDSIAWSNAKNNATLLVCHVNIFRMITNEADLMAKWRALVDDIYNTEQPPFKG